MDSGETKGYQVYILRCGDGTLYTGSTNDLARRVRTHQRGKGAKYTRSRLPVELVYVEEAGDKSQALRREAAIKALSRAEKLELAVGYRTGQPSGSPEDRLALGDKTARET